MPEDPATALVRLEADGFVVRREERWRTTRRWQGVMARAALSLYRSGQRLQDLRVPIAVALVALYADLPDEDLATYVEVMLPIETAELDPLGSRAAAP